LIRKRLAFAASILALTISGAAGAQQQLPAEQLAQSDLGGEIVVTATRNSEPLSKVPISVQAFSREKMQVQGIREFADVVRFTPGLSTESGPGGSVSVSIRGIASTAGAATTGIYIDDVPIQVRQIGYAAGSVFPAIFDLDRVEVLRGPQGTLFGAGSEGGTVRFIQAQPDLNKYSAYARAEGSLTPNAEGSYEGGVAVGGPLIEDKIGFRASAYYRRDGGYIDTVPGTYSIADPSGASYGDAIDFTQTGEGVKNSNWQDSLALRAALKFQFSETFTATPSVFYQDQNFGDPAANILLGASDISSGKLRRQLFLPGPVTPGGFSQLSLPSQNEGSTKLFVAANTFELGLDAFDIIATTSYLEQKKVAQTEFTYFYSITAVGEPVPSAGASAPNLYWDRQRSFTQEVRFQSNQPDARLRWVVGGYYNRSVQTSHQLGETNLFSSAQGFYGIPTPSNGDPFGPGHSGYENAYGVPMIGGSGTYLADARGVEKQYAAFGQIDFEIIDKLTLTAGLRWSRNKLDYSLVTAGGENNLNAPFGAPCPTGGYCEFNGGGAFAPSFPIGQVNTSEDAFTPKFSVSYEVDDRNLVYGTVAKGFRPGGSQLQLPTSCNGDLVSLGFVDGSGNAVSPLTYDSDSVWSYEVGSKNSLFGGKVRTSGSAYVIKWKNIQTQVGLPQCGYALVTNSGSATVKGFDLTIDVSPVTGLLLSSSIGYTHTSLDDGLYRPDGNAVLPRGSAIGGAGSPWSVIVSANYDVPLDGEWRPYMRVDYIHNSAPGRSERTALAAFNYDALIPRNATNQVNSRIGVRHGNVEVSLFVNNLTDSHPILDASHTTADYLWSATTLRPRTFGITGSFRM